MNDHLHRSQLESLKAELGRVELDLRSLRLKADQIEARIAAQERVSPAPAIVAQELTPPPIIPPVQEAPAPRRIVLPPPLPRTPPASVASPQPEPVRLSSIADETSPLTPAPTPQPAAPEPESFEMRLGTYWFVRIGIVMVLTAMVFLGNYAYQHYVSLMGPVGKVILMYLASAGLLAAGAILPRKQERLKNYGQVLFAGGLAAVYFTTYAAHHFPNLRVIQSAVLDGILLLAWTSFIVWLADRKKSEVTAIFAIGLAYYTALITNVGSFTAVSNLLLATAAVFFLVRNRWVTLTFISLAASYGSYFYWRYYAGASMAPGLIGSLSIAGYWIIFTAAVFLSRHTEFTTQRRAGFLTFNNGAAFALLTFSMLHSQSGDFWKLAIISGAILLALAYAAAKFIADDELPRRAYLAQGLLLTTLGLITRLSGPTLALVLAVESALLLIFSTQWKNQLLRFASIIVGTLAAGWLLGTLEATDSGAWIKAGAVFALLLFNSVWSAKHEAVEDQPQLFRPLPAYFATVGLIAWCSAVTILAPPPFVAPILAATAVTLTAAHYLLRVRELTLLSQGALMFAQCHLVLFMLGKHLGLDWKPISVIVASLALAAWWRHQKTFEIETQAKRFLEIAFAFAAALVTQIYLPQSLERQSVITASWILTLAWTALGAGLRSWPIALAGQIFLITAAFGTVLETRALHGQQTTNEAFGLIGAFVLLAAIANKLSNRRPDSPELRLVPHAYQFAAAIVALSWVNANVAEDLRFITLTILFAASFTAALAGARYIFAPGVMLAGAGLFFWLAGSRANGAELQNLLAIAILGAAQFLARRKSPFAYLTEAAHHFWLGINAAILWLFVSRWVIVHSSGAHFYLTASWAILAFALFGIGFAMRERTYRWAALTVLACALLRVIMLDVWKLETLYRIFSFLALGVVLLALGYFYTRFQERIAKWL